MFLHLLVVGGVFVFLVVSGFGLATSFRRKGLEHFWTKKAVRVFIPWLFVCLVAYLKDVLSGDVSIFNPSWWYLKFLLFCYILFYACFKWCYRYRWYLLIAFAVLTFVLGDGLQAEQCCSFQVGILLAERQDVKEWIGKNVKILFFISIVLFLMSLSIKQIAFVRMFLDDFYLASHLLNLVLKTSLGILMMTFSLIAFRYVNGCYARFVGKISYELYLVHVAVVIGLCKDLAFHSFAKTFVFIAMSFLLSWVLFLIDDKLLKFYSNKLLNQR